MDDSKASWIIGSYGYSASIMLDQEIEAKTVAWEKFQNEDSVWRTLKSLEEVLVIDDENVTDRYKMDLELKYTDSNGDVKGMGIISPAAVLKISILCGEILWNHEWTESVLTKWAENLGEDSIEGIDKHPLKKMTTFPVWRIFNMILAGICALVLVIMTIVELIQYLMCVIEYSVTSSVCLVLVPCILFDGTKDMANKILPTLFAQAMKMCMIVICMYFGVWVYMRLLDDVVFTGGGMTLRLFSYVVFLGLLSFALVTNAPKIAATIMTGSPQMSMGEFVQTATAAAGVAVTAGHLIAGGGRIAAGGLSFARNRGGDLAEAAQAAVLAAEPVLTASTRRRKIPTEAETTARTRTEIRSGQILQAQTIPQTENTATPMAQTARRRLTATGSEQDSVQARTAEELIHLQSLKKKAPALCLAVLLQELRAAALRLGLGLLPKTLDLPIEATADSRKIPLAMAATDFQT